MILKKFFGKTIEVAKKSARQMYGEDIVILESFNADDKNDAGVTVLVDTPASQKKPAKQESSRFRNVFYKRSDIAATANHADGHRHDSSDSGAPAKQHASANGRFSSDPGEKRSYETISEPGRFAQNGSTPKISNNLKALRRFAKEEMESSRNGHVSSGRANGEQNSRSAPGKKNLAGKTRFQPGSGSTNGNPWENGSSRMDSNGHGGDSGWAAGTGPLDDEAARSSAVSEKDPSRETISSFFKYDEDMRKSRFQPSRPADMPSPENASEAGKSRREVSALHKRFDKLESLLDSALISSNLDYASHPAFQQLVKTGIKPTVIARWFREIIEKGIDPEEEPGLFMSELSAIIRKALSGSSVEKPGKYMLFTGPSGSGKTHLIMKLLLHPEFMSSKRVAVVSLMPEEQKKRFYYTILDPFCADHNIRLFTVRNAGDIKKFQQDWESYDHILFDSPSIPIEQDDSFRQYWKLRQMLVSITPLEVHYVVNASLNRYYFRKSGNMHHPLQPDFVAITHLDEVSQWGPIIPFLEEMGCGARYISMGSSVPDGLAEFSPAWFAQQVLQDT